MDKLKNVIPTKYAKWLLSKGYAIQIGQIMTLDGTKYGIIDNYRVIKTQYYKIG